MSIQQIFNKALPFYAPDFGHIEGFCLCLQVACEQNLITIGEFRDACAVIQEYIEELNSLTNQTIPDIFLSRALKSANLPYGFEDKLAIYKDWENRPRSLRIL